MRARLLEALGDAYRGINEGEAGAPLLEAAARLNLDPAVNDPLAAARALRSKALGILAVRGSTDEAEDAAQRAFELLDQRLELGLVDLVGRICLGVSRLQLGGQRSRDVLILLVDQLLLGLVPGLLGVIGALLVSIALLSGGGELGGSAITTDGDVIRVVGHQDATERVLDAVVDRVVGHDGIESFPGRYLLADSDRR